MELNDLLHLHEVDRTKVIVLRHRPHEPELRKVLPWLAAERPELFNAYQQTHSSRLESSMERLAGNGYVASFLGMEPATAVFVGLYEIAAAAPITFEEYWRVPAYIEMKEHFGMQGWRKPEEKERQLWFDLKRLPFYEHWQGKLIVNWPPPERSWWRRAHRNTMSIRAVLEESLFAESMPRWNELALTWAELDVLPRRWKAALSEWRGIYFIYDRSDRKGYVGSAYGKDNLLGRWLNYAPRGHGGNALLRKRDPQNFVFSILQRVSPDLEPAEVIGLESSWKGRLHTLEPLGLNKN